MDCIWNCGVSQEEGVRKNGLWVWGFDWVIWGKEFTLDGVNSVIISITLTCSKGRLKQYKPMIGKAAVLFSERQGCLVFCGGTMPELGEDLAIAVLRGNHLCGTLFLHSQPSELWENKHLWCKPPRLCLFCYAFLANQYRPITSKETEVGTKTLPMKKSPGPVGVNGEVY